MVTPGTVNNKNVFDLTESWTFAFLMHHKRHINMLKIVAVIPLACAFAAAFWYHARACNAEMTGWRLPAWQGASSVMCLNLVILLSKWKENLLQGAQNIILKYFLFFDFNIIITFTLCIHLSFKRTQYIFAVQTGQILYMICVIYWSSLWLF